MSMERGFQEITVMRLGYQTPTQRFGPQSTPHTPMTDDSDSEEEDEELENNHNAVPKIAELRMNLTVLSQYHNLYFAVYGDQIYVYRPQGSRQALPSKPSFILDPPQSEQGLEQGLKQNPKQNPHRCHEHIINHLIIGDLGNKEVLLCSCHDGDIIAYYTQTIENAIHSKVNDGSSIKPFFEENIGASAWGLAIHKQSRLIAVGSNNHEVQVFAFGLYKPASKARHTTIGYTEILSNPLRSRFPVRRLAELPLTENKKIARNSNFRMVFKLEPLGDNIPYVAFSDDFNGDAQSIVAKDIRGALWFFSLWTEKRKRLQPMTDEVSSRHAPLGWAIIILPKTFFKSTYNPTETWGSQGKLMHRRNGFDISKTVIDVRDSFPWYDRIDSDDEEDDEEDEEDEEGEEEDEGEDEDDDEDNVDEDDSADDEIGEHTEPANPEPDPSNLPHRDDQDDLMFNSEAPSPNISSASQSAQTVQSPTILSSSPPSTLGVDASLSTSSTDGPIFCFTTSGPTIIHTNRHSIHLLPTDHFPPTHCKNALRQEYPHDDLFPRALSDYDRLNMLAAIPELSLVLAASQVGRVALLTVTRPVDGYTRISRTVAMRLELILPFASEETKEHIRPSYGLLGMAVGPMQGERERGAKTGEGPRRWRLMLHYFNHAILSYEISRREETGEIILF